MICRGGFFGVRGLKLVVAALHMLGKRKAEKFLRGIGLCYEGRCWTRQVHS